MEVLRNVNVMFIYYNVLSGLFSQIQIFSNSENAHNNRLHCQDCHYALTPIYNTCAENNFGGEVVYASVLPLAAIAHFNYHWQYFAVM